MMYICYVYITLNSPRLVMFLCNFSFSFFQLMSFLIRPKYSNWSIFHCGQNWINTKKNVHNLFFLLLLPSICHHWGNINDIDKNIGQIMAIPKYGCEFHLPRSWRHAVLLYLDTARKILGAVYKLCQPLRGKGDLHSA